MTSEATPLIFSTKITEIPVTIDDKSYILREASGGAACQYRNYLLDNTEFEDGKPKRTKGMANLEPLLVSLCLSEVLIDPETKEVKWERAVPLATVRSWPTPVTKGLYAKAKEISRLEEKPETVEDLEEAIKKLQARLDKLRQGEESGKNLSTDTMDG